MGYNSHYRDVEKKFVDTSIDLFLIMMYCKKIVDNVSQEDVNSLTSLVELFEKNYSNMKIEISKLIVESVEDSEEIDIKRTDAGFEI